MKSQYILYSLLFIVHKLIFFIIDKALFYNYFIIMIYIEFTWDEVKNKQNIRKHKISFEEAKSKLFFDIKTTYFNIYFIQKGIKITRDNLAILTTFQQLAIIKVETGKSSVVDELRVEMEINELENQLAYLLFFLS